MSIFYYCFATATGALAGKDLSFYLSRRLRPIIMDEAMTIAGVDENELFYFKNKLAVDGIGESFRLTSIMKF